jgi:hypothetical protein
MCLQPRKYWRLSAVNADGDEVIIPCRECANCLRFYRDREARRLRAHYANRPAPWVTNLKCGLEEREKVYSACHRAAEILGFCRRDDDHVALLSLTPPMFTSRHLKARVIGQPYQMIKRGLRSWRRLLSGMLHLRQEYRKHTNRFYYRGVAPAETKEWKIETRGGGISRRHPEFAGGRDLRAIRVLPNGELIALRTPDRRIRRGPAPESVRVARPEILRINDQPRQAGAEIARQFSILKAAAAGRSGIGVVAQPPPQLPPPSRLVGRGYRTSLQSTQSTKEYFDAWAERMAQKARDRGSG